MGPFAFRYLFEPVSVRVRVFVLAFGVVFVVSKIFLALGKSEW